MVPQWSDILAERVMEAIVQAARVVRRGSGEGRRSGMEHYDLLSRSLCGILAFFGQIVGSAESDYSPPAIMMASLSPSSHC
jgi:hypothetical protein